MGKITLENMGAEAAKVAADAPRPAGRRRNYKAMGDDNLVRAASELSAGEGDAYDRCLNGGSGDVEGDLELVNRLIRARSVGTQTLKGPHS